MGAHGQVIARSLFRNGVKCQDIEAKTEQAQPGRVAVGVLRLAAFMWTPWLMAGEEESDDDEDAIGREFTLWAAPRWHLLRELFMDEDLNHTALGVSVEKRSFFGAGGDIAGIRLRAWRLDLDLDDNGTVTFVEFSNQCRRLGFQGRVRQIWTSLRPLDDRALEFAELAPDESEHVEKFADLIWNVSGYDLDKAWGLFDYDKKNKLTKADFVQSAEHLGFTGNAEMIFQGLDREGLGWVWRADFEYIPKVSRNARLRLKETEGQTASLVSFARYQIGSCEELITMLGLGGGTSEVTVCDLAARLTALGFDGDAQHAAVLAARCDRGIGTKISAQKLLKVLTSNAKGTNVDQGGPKA
ncbi:unnamed protein product [Durusdinium trenchii]|uniref:Calmodulin n=1 Tax=Durusdinium trenchii TaxID=1381693 RepID=A0ABP0SUB1_9DINO